MTEAAAPEGAPAGGIARALRWLDRLSEAFETRPWGPWHVLGIVAAVISVRNALEITVARNPVYEPLAAFVHYPLAYLGPFVALTLVLASWAGLPPARVGKLMSLAWVLTLIPPVADLVLHPGGTAPPIGYLYADPAELDWIWIHFFDPTVTLHGTTLGIRIEALVAVVCGGVFAGVRSRSILRGVGAAITIYPVSLFFFSLPLLVQGALRWVFPGLDQNTMLRGEGWLVRPDPASSADTVAAAWLVPLMVLLGALWWWLEGKAPSAERWLRGRLGRAALPGLPAVCVGLSLSGVAAAATLYFPGNELPPSAPYDLLGPVLLACGTGLLAGGTLRIGAGRHGAPLLIAALGLGASAALGTAASLGLLVTGAALAPIGLRLGESGWERGVLNPIAAACAGAGAFLGGWSLVIGEFALARLPNELLAWPALAALGFALLAMAPPDRRPVIAVSGGAFVGCCVLGTMLALPSLNVALVTLILAGGAVLVGIGVSVQTGGGTLLTGLLFAGSSVVVTVAALAGLGEDRLASMEERVRCVGRVELLEGQRLEEEGQWERAKTSYRNALKCQRGYTPAQLALGNGFLRHEENLKRAAMWFERAARSDPRSDAARSNLAAVYLRQDRPQQALALLEEAMELDPRNLETLYNRARALEDLGKSREAISAWREFVHWAKGHPDELEDIRFARKRVRLLRQEIGSAGSAD